MSDLNALMAALAANSQDSGEELEKPIQAKRLGAAYKRYAACLEQIPFAVGSLVTPRKDASVRGGGLPHVVLEVRNAAAPDFTGDFGAVTYGRRAQLRVARMAKEDVVCYWVEAWEFEVWQGGIAA